MERGNCDASCVAYEWLAIAAGRFADYDSAYRFGRLGYELTEQRGLRRFQSRTLLLFGHMVIPWTKPIRTARDLLRRAFAAANEVGDIVFASGCCIDLNSNMLAAGDPLVDVEAEAERGLAYARQTRFGLMVDLITVQLALIRTLRGRRPISGQSACLHFMDPIARFGQLQRRIAGQALFQLSFITCVMVEATKLPGLTSLRPG